MIIIFFLGDRDLNRLSGEKNKQKTKTSRKQNGPSPIGREAERERTGKRRERG